MPLKLTSWLFRAIAAIILLQTLFFKFTGAPESVAIFTQLGIEPYGRYAIGVVELITSILLLIPGTVVYGAFLGAGVMAGAIMGHVTELGFAGDMGSLAVLAIVVLFSCCVVLFLHRDQIPFIKIA